MQYPGNELETFAFAENWKQYWSTLVRPYIQGTVAEVGAGIGSNTLLMMTPRVARWCCFEPDPDLAHECEEALTHSESTALVSVENSVFRRPTNTDLYDAIIYIDVLEHIEDDAEELLFAQSRLRPGGTLIVLGPAHQYLFSELDSSVGHFRRYTLESLRHIRPNGMSEKRSGYLDSLGYFASLANKWMLKQSTASSTQVKFWDSWIVPVSRILDRLLFFKFGKTVYIVWEST